MSKMTQTQLVMADLRQHPNDDHRARAARLGIATKQIHNVIRRAQDYLAVQNGEITSTVELRNRPHCPVCHISVGVDGKASVPCHVPGCASYEPPEDYARSITGSSMMQV